MWTHSAPVAVMAGPDAGEVAAELAALARQRGTAHLELARHLVGSREGAREVYQDAFVRALGARRSFRGESRLETWFTRILINTARQHRRRHAVRERLARLWGPPAPPALLPTGEQRAQDRATREAIARALARLSAAQRETFALVHLQGHTLEEAAELLGRAPGTLKSHLHRALTKLRVELRDVRTWEGPEPDRRAEPSPPRGVGDDEACGERP